MNTNSCKSRQGIVYVVTGGRNYIGELLASVDSVRKYEPDLPITVFSRFPVPERHGLDCMELNSNENPHKMKVFSLRRSPYEQTLFLDTDTNIRGSLQTLFAKLDEFDFCVANSHHADYSKRPPKYISMSKDGRYNTGVLLYRNSPAVHSFLARWEEAVNAHDSNDMWAGHNGDQRFFNDLTDAGVPEKCGVLWGVLENLKWNCRGIAVKAVKASGRWSDVKILHHRTKLMKLRKLMYSIVTPSIARVIALKSWRLATTPFRRV